MEDSRLSSWFDEHGQEKIIDLLFHMMDVYLKEEDGYELECISGCADLIRKSYLAIPHHVQTGKELEQNKKRTQRLSRFLKFVDENYMFRIKLADFAEQEDMSLAYMSVFVRKELGQTFQEYVNSVRFNAACKMMAAGESSMQTICLESGFSDYRYFSNEFRRRKGVTPEQYSRNPDPSPDAQKTHQSLHSLERFYSRARSGELLVDYREKIRQDRAI
jgi:AraC-like DNA-binding protein